jgi:hypothetical protein
MSTSIRDRAYNRATQMYLAAPFVALGIAIALRLANTSVTVSIIAATTAGTVIAVSGGYTMLTAASKQEAAERAEQQRFTENFYD